MRERGPKTLLEAYRQEIRAEENRRTIAEREGRPWPPPPYRRPTGPRELIEDENGTRCYLCGKSYSRGLDREHIIPRSLGGTEDESNIASACWPCNTQKGSSIVSLGVSSRAPCYTPAAVVSAKIKA